MLGMSAAVFGKWVERSGPRKTMVASCVCFCGGLLISAIGVKLKMLWLLYIGYGFTGGIGLGLGYISPVSTLIKWFPDRPGMATGMAIMGFGGGALIGAPLGVKLMDHFRSPLPSASPKHSSRWHVSMRSPCCSARHRPRPARGLEAGWLGAERHVKPMVTNANVAVDVAWKTPQFWCLWVVLCMNVSAGIGILGQASKMCSDMFGVSAAVGGGFAGLLSIFNMGGRFVWSSVSDYIGRQGGLLHLLPPRGGAVLRSPVDAEAFRTKRSSSIVTAIIITMYGGGFATIPAYLRDMFGTYQVGAIHGRLITAWSVAAILGPSLVNYISTARIEAGVPKAEAYNSTMFLMAGLLIVGLIANLLVRPVHPKYHRVESPKPELMKNISLVIAWTWIAVPLGWGVYQSVQKSMPLFNGQSEPAALNRQSHNEAETRSEHIARHSLQSTGMLLSEAVFVASRVPCALGEKSAKRFAIVRPRATNSRRRPCRAFRH